MIKKTEHTQQPQKELSAAEYMRHLEMQLTWRPAETPPAEEGHYLTHMKFKNGDESYSVNRYVKKYGWILFQGFQFVVEWMPIPGKKGEFGT